MKPSRTPTVRECRSWGGIAIWMTKSDSLFWPDASLAGLRPVKIHRMAPENGCSAEMLVPPMPSVTALLGGERFLSFRLISQPLGTLTENSRLTRGRDESRPGRHECLRHARYFFPAAASLTAFRCGRSRSSSWHATSIMSPFWWFRGKEIVQGRVYTTGSVIVAS